MSVMPIWGRWIGWLLIGVNIALAMNIVPPFIAQSKLVFTQTQANGVDARLTDVRPEKQAWLVEQNGGRWGRYGWYLAAGEQGSLRMELPAMHPGIHTLRFRAFIPGHLSVSVKGPSTSEEISVHRLDGRELQVLVHGPTELAIVASSELSQEQLVLDRFAVDWVPLDRLMGDEAERQRLGCKAVEVVERFELEKEMGMWEEVLNGTKRENEA